MRLPCRELVAGVREEKHALQDVDDRTLHEPLQRLPVADFFVRRHLQEKARELRRANNKKIKIMKRFIANPIVNSGAFRPFFETTVGVRPTVSDA